MTGSIDVYASIAIAVVWIFWCFTLNVSRKLHLLFVTYIYRGKWNIF